ncbi:MAG: TIGR04282 family arsenosugar biosynthesis glycosyltransferase [Chthoniobacterales bacterium]
MNRKAVLIFADPIGLDLARRRLPRFLRPLLSWRRLAKTSHLADLHLFSSGKLPTFEGCTAHEQVGANFAERLEAATEKLAAFGYDEIVVIGADCPSLAPSDIAMAFHELADKRLVLGPDHRGGCYLIALRAEDRALLQGVRWKRNRDYDQLRQRVAAGAVASLAVKLDVDSWADVWLLARAGHRLAEWCCAFLSAANATHNCFVDLSAQALRVRGQMPPPASAA